MGILHQHLMKRVFTFLLDNEPVVITLCDVRSQLAGASIPILSLCDVDSVQPTGGGSGGGNTAPVLNLEDIDVDFIAPPALTPPTIDFTGTDGNPWTRGATYNFVCVVDDDDGDQITDFIVSDSFNQTSALSVTMESWNGSTWDDEGVQQITPHAFRPAGGLGSHARFRATITYAVSISEPVGNKTILVQVSNDAPTNDDDSITRTVD